MTFDRVAWISQASAAGLGAEAEILANLADEDGRVSQDQLERGLNLPPGKLDEMFEGEEAYVLTLPGDVPSRTDAGH